MEQPPLKKTPQPKESFSAYVTRVTGITTAISLGGLFLGLPETLVGLARMVATYSIVTWVALVGLPIAVKYSWINRGHIKPFVHGIKNKSGSIAQVTGEVISGLAKPDSSQASTPNIKRSSQYIDLPEPMNYLPTNPKPFPEGSYTLKNAGEFIRNTVQMAGLKMDEIPEILQLNSGPTLQSITFQLPPGLQLSHLARKRDDLANHSGMMQGFSVEPSSFPSAATFIIPQDERAFVYMRDVAESFIQFAGTAELPFILGKDTKGDPLYIDLAKLPHLLVAGATGSGKSVFINTLLESLTSVRSPDELNLLLIDPKMVELNMYNGMPHLLQPTVTDPRRASMSLKKVVVEVEKRYAKFMGLGMRNISQYNEACPNEKLSYIVVVIDEYADLMMVAQDDVEDAVVRLAQIGRACGVHLVLGTQRPSVDVVTGIIKSNLPSRVAFRLPSSTDYRTILEGGSRSLLGLGDGICMKQDGKLIRFQSAAISVKDEEMNAYIETTKKFWSNRSTASNKAVSQIDFMNLNEDEVEEVPVKLILKGSGKSFEKPEERFEQPLITDGLTDSNPSNVSETAEDSGESDVNEVVAEHHPILSILPEEPVKGFWDEDYPMEEVDQYDRFVALIQSCGGWSMSKVNEHLNIEMPVHIKYVERMVRDGLLGDFDHGLRMRPWNGNHSGEEESSLSDESDLMEKTKEYICRMRSTRTSEIRDYLRVRKEKVLKIMQLLAEEGFLERPTHANSGYTISWLEEEIDAYLQKIDME